MLLTDDLLDVVGESQCIHTCMDALCYLLIRGEDDKINAPPVPKDASCLNLAMTA